MPVGQCQPVVGDVSEIKQYNNTRVVSSSSTAVEIERNNVIPTVVIEDTLIDIEGVQAEPEFISCSPQPPIKPLHTTSLPQQRSSVTSSSATTSGLQIQYVPNTNVDDRAENNNKTLQSATYCQTYNTDTMIHSALSTAARAMDYQYPYEPNIHVSH